MDIKEIMLGSSIIIGISFVLSHIIPPTATAQKNIKEYENLKEMEEMDDNMHQQDILLHTFSGYNLQRDKLYHTTDNKYHSAKYNDEKINAARDFHALMLEQNKLLEKMGKVDSGYNKLHNQFQKEIEELQHK